MAEVPIDYYDLTFVLNGSMTYIADGEVYVLEKNDAIFLKPHTLRKRLEGSGPVKYVSFNFHLFPEVTLPFDSYMPGCISAETRNLVSVFSQNLLFPAHHSSEKVTNMLNYILFDILETITLKCSNEHVQKIIHYIDTHLTEKITLKTVSDYVHLSKEYTSSVFKKEMQKTLTDYINERKLLLAKELILRHEMPLSEVSSYLGFENYNYFSRIFKKYYGISPIVLKNKR